VATYIADEETCNLIERYAERVGKNKTAALRELLQRELAERDWKAGGNQRYESAMEIIRRRPKRSPEVLPRRVFDELYSYLDEEREKYAAEDKSGHRSRSST